MAMQTKPKGAGDFIVSEANGHRSREAVMVTVPAGGLEPGTVLGKITSSGKRVPLNPTGSNGSEVVDGILIFGAAATGAARDVRMSALVRDAEVHDEMLVYPAGATSAQISTAKNGIRALGLAIRTET